jgi:RNA polymerase sigma-70 factor (ECF subfamily)
MNRFKDNLKNMYPELMRVANRLVEKKDDATDLVQNALLRALEKQNLFKGGNQTGWVIKIMKNMYYDEYRKNKIEVKPEGEERKNLEKVWKPKSKWKPSYSVDRTIHKDEETLENIDKENNLKKKNSDRIMDDNYEANDLEIGDIKKAINRLGSKCQEILTLIGMQYKYAEISEKLSIPIGTTMSRLLRCRKQLHKELYGTSE